MQQKPIIPQTGSQRISGMDCPVCQAFIPIDVTDLLYRNGVTCPHCRLALTVNQALSRQALDALAKVDMAMRKVRETETFNG